MKVLLFIAKGFEIMEFSPFVDILGWARNDFGHDIQVVTCGFSRQVISTFHIPVIADIIIDDIQVDDYAALLIPGGFEEYGFYEDSYSEDFLDIIREFYNKDKIIASICVAALPLGKSGILKNKRATTYNLSNGNRQKQLKEFGVNVINEPVVIDGKIITCWNPSTAIDVAFKLLEFLTSESNTDYIKAIMGFKKNENNQ
jgi:4-methyl-5(b-hydroxyethyl)-thiazole monophosphate biosynthesis